MKADTLTPAEKVEKILVTSAEKTLVTLAMIGTMHKEMMRKQEEKTKEFCARAKASLPEFQNFPESQDKICAIDWSRVQIVDGAKGSVCKLVDKHKRVLAKGGKEILSFYLMYCTAISKLKVQIGLYKNTPIGALKGIAYNAVYSNSLVIDELSREFFNFADSFELVISAKDIAKMLREEAAKTPQQVEAEENELENKAMKLLAQAEGLLRSGKSFTDVQHLIKEASEIGQDLDSEKVLAKVNEIRDKALNYEY